MTIHPAIAGVLAEHYMESERWHEEQASGLAAVLIEIITALDLPPDATPTGVKGDVVLFGSWWASRVVSAVRSAVEVEATTGFEPVNRGFADLSRPSSPPSPTVADDDPSSLTEAHRT